MNRITYLSLIFIALSIFSACQNTESKDSKEQNIVTVDNDSISINTILVYYFHGSIRCHTCVSVDEDTHQYIKDLFPVKLDKGNIIFKSINIDENESPDLIEKYQIYGQTLLFIKGDKIIDLTEDAFKYVTTSPEKWKQIVDDNLIDLMNS